MASTAIATPVSGETILQSWGAQVAAAHNGIQSGAVNVSVSSGSTGSTAVTFPRPFSAAPIVVAVQASGNTAFFAMIFGISATGFTAAIQHRDGTAGAAGPLVVHWVAIGLP
jgi:hypothetical protein